MAYIPNKYECYNPLIKITEVIHNFCPIGQDIYTNNIQITIEPNQCIPDYIDVTAFIKSLEGKELTIEDTCFEIIEHLIVEYSPKYVKVYTSAPDAVHSSVEFSLETRK